MKNYLHFQQPVLMMIIFILTVNINTSFSQVRMQDDTIKALQATMPPVINGIGDDDCWLNAKWQAIGQEWIPYGESVDIGDYSGKYKVAWSATENTLCFLVEITDDKFIDGYVYDSIPGIGGGYYNDDILEVFLDENRSGGLHIYDDAENAFSYHIVINAPADGNTTDQCVVCDIAGSGGDDSWYPDYASHFPQFTVKKTGNQYVWEFSLAVYNDTYDHNNPEVSRIKLQEGKVMGLSLAYCDNDDPDENPKKRDNFFGSVWVPESANNDHWKNADGYGTLMLISDVTRLEEGFVNPPLYARPRVYWGWLNSMATKESITRDLEELKDKGFAGAIIFDCASSEYNLVRVTPAGPVFASEEWKELFVHALREADCLDLEISLNIQSGWNPGGPSVLPEDGMKKIVWAEEKVTGPVKYTKVLPMASGYHYKDIAVQAYKTEEGKQLDPIKNWENKSLNQKFRGRGAYPLYKLREQHSDPTDAVYLHSDSIIDLSAKMNKDGFLQWDVPEGTWVILRFGSVLTGAQVSTPGAGWQGLCFDHLNSEALENYFAAVVDPLLESAGDLVGKSLKYLHTDSWEMGMVNWTKHFREEFRTLRGYDLLPYLPVLSGRIVDSREVSNRFLYDFRKTVSDLIADRMYARFAEMAHERGLLIHPESGGPHSAPIDGLKCLGRNDVPMGEFWARANTHRVSEDERLFIKQSSSAAHIYGKRFVAGEGPSSIGPHWERAPKDLKSVFDRNFCEGINRFYWNIFASSPEEFGIPGNEYFCGTHMNPNTTWWNKSEAWNKYLSRCSYLLSQGMFQADVCIYYGDDVPNFVLRKRTLEDLGPGYDYDECNAEVILTRMSVKNGNIVLPDGMTYRLLRLPDRTAITLEVLQKIEQMVQDGATIIGPKPIESTGLEDYPESNREVQEIADKLWGECDGKTITENRYGKGRVFWGKSMRDILISDGIRPDFDFKSSQENTELDYIHRKASDTDIYFVVNRLARHGIYDTKYRYLTTLPDRYEEVDCYFRVSGKIPEIWDPMTGKILKQPVYREENGRTVVRLRLNPEGSVFVVFREPSENDHIIRIKKDDDSLYPISLHKVGDMPQAKVLLEGKNIFLEAFEPGNYELKRSDGKIAEIKIDDIPSPFSINSPWKLNFPKGWGAPEEVTISKLKSWTEFDNDGIKYFSGTASYHNQFNLSKKKIKGKRFYLNLGNVQELAEVILNGKSLDVTWIAPFQIDITDEVKEGKNKLEIQVVNLWPNRLIGDQFLPVEERYTKTNVRKFDKDYLLRTSGLLGPVQIIISSKVPVRF